MAPRLIPAGPDTDETRVLTPDRSLTRYVALWVLAGLAAACALALDASLAGAPWAVAGSAFAIAVALVAAGEATELKLDHGNAVEVVTLLEAAVVAVVVTLPPLVAAAATVAGVTAVQLVRGRPAIKIVFNASQYAVGAALAAGVFGLAGGATAEPSLAWATAALVGMLGFGVVNTVAMNGVIAILESRPLGRIWRSELRLTAITVLGNSAVGLTAVILWRERPELALLVVVPLFTLHLAYRGVVQSAALLDEVRTERDRLDRVVRGASDGIVLLDAAGNVELWSPAMHELTGIAEERARGRHIDDLIEAACDDGRPVRVGAPLESRDAADPVSVEDYSIETDEGSREVRATHHVLFDDDRPIADVALFHDVTRERLVDRLKDDFISRVSHELRTPLTPIKGFAHVLMDKELPAATRERILERIVDRADDMVRLIDDLLLVANLGTLEETGLARTELDVAPVVEEVVNRFRDRNPAREFDVLVSGETSASIDPKRLGQLLDNLLNNACKFSPDDRHVEVTVAGTVRGVTVSVRDFGRGIPRDHQDLIFDRFHRVEDPLVMEAGGLGLGLFISRRLAELLDGTLTVESELGDGARFDLWLPSAATPLERAG